MKTYEDRDEELVLGLVVGIAGGIYIIIGVVVTITCTLFAIKMRSCPQQRQEHTEAAMIPMHVTTSTDTPNDDYEIAVHYENLVTNTQTRDNTDAGVFQPPSASVAGDLDDVGTGDISREPCASVRYESLSDHPRVQPTYENLTGN